MPKDDKADSLSIELDAVKMIVSTLKPLDAEARERVLASLLNLLSSGYLPRVPRAGAAIPETESVHGLQVGVDVRALKEQKQPRSAVEMATLVAFYLAELAPSSERRNHITTADVQRYFKQAGYPMPSNIRMALVNTKNAGYLDQLGEGRYRLNPVGYNLIAHGLPRGSQERSSKRRSSFKRKLKTNRLR